MLSICHIWEVLKFTELREFLDQRGMTTDYLEIQQVNRMLREIEIQKTLVNRRIEGSAEATQPS